MNLTSPASDFSEQIPKIHTGDRYFFKLYALNMVLGLKPRAAAAQVLASSSKHVPAEAALMGTYQRSAAGQFGSILHG